MKLLKRHKIMKIKLKEEKDILVGTTRYSRNQVFAFQKYIDLF